MKVIFIVAALSVVSGCDRGFDTWMTECTEKQGRGYDDCEQAYDEQSWEEFKEHRQKREQSREEDS